MDAPSQSDIFLFGQFRLDRRSGGLFRCVDGGSPVPVGIGSRALDVLGVLVERHGELVSKDAIMSAVWPGMAVEDANLTMQVSALRRVLEATGEGKGWIQTIPGRGYRFSAPVTRSAPAIPGDAPAIRPAAPRPARTRASLVTMTLAGLLAAGIAAGGAWMWFGGPTPRPIAYSPQDRRQSIIVLPFENSSGDRGQDGLAAGITRTVADMIAGDPAIPIVPASTAAAYREKPLDLRIIGRDQDVHFALTGNARREAGHLIVSATLYETGNVRQVWSQQCDRVDGPDAGNIVVHGIWDNIWQATTDAEAARAMREHPGSLDKRDLMLIALASDLVNSSKASFLTRLALVDRALALDPNYLWALQYEARLRAGLVVYGYSSDRDADTAMALKAADRMLLIAPNATNSLRARAAVLRAQGNWDEAAAISSRLIELQPLESNRHSEYGFVLMAQGHHGQALEQFDTARQLAAGADAFFWIDANIAMALVANDRFSEAISRARLAIANYPPDSGRLAEFPWLALIAAEAADGQETAARADMQAFLATPRSLRSMGEVLKVRLLAANPTLLDGLRRAGMPET